MKNMDSLTEYSDSADRYFELFAARHFHDLSEHPEARAEAIASHYCQLAHCAAELRKLIVLSRGFEVASEDLWSLNEVIKMQTRLIQDAHYRAFGIKLEWPERKAD